MKQVIALLLTLSVMVLAIACGGTGQNDVQNDTQNNTQNSVQDDAQNDVQDDAQNDVQDDAQDETQEDDGETAQDDVQNDGGDPQEDGETDSQEVPTLSHSDVTLKAAGNSFTLEVKGMSGAYSVAYTSADAGIATVNEKGVVTAAAPGTTTVSASVEKDGRAYELSCTVRCSWKEDSGSGSNSGDSSGTASVDLTAFYNDMTGKYEFQDLQAFSGEVLETYYPGMGAVSTKQCLIMGTMITMNNGEFCLVEVSDSKDVDTVKSIFQARIDYMVNGGAWYPAPTEQWTNNSRVVSSGNFVMMVVHESCDDIVEAFNGLFA